MKKTLHFKTNTLLKNLVGKDLINNDNIAIVELVKNSYDANSNGAKVLFTNFADNGESTSVSKIIITDEGNGMDLIDIRDKWLNIAYSEKKYFVQKNGAYLAGNKGIGRFSCDRLGEKLDLLTRKRGGDLLYLHINWPEFEIEGKKDLTIQSIDLDVATIDDVQAAKMADLHSFPKHGTALVITTPRNSWNRERIKDVKIALEKFLNPNQLFLRDKFSIILSVPAYEKEDKGKEYPDRINGEIKNQIFENLKFNATYIEAKVSKDNKTVSIVLYHEGEKVFYILENNFTYSLLAGTHIVIYYLNPYKKAYFKRQTGVRLMDFGSIFLFLNGFRIAPYGDRSDDWLGIDNRKTQGTNRYLGSREIVGRIEITGSENQFTPISSREGLKNTSAFNQLRNELFLDVLRKLERFVVEGLEWDTVPRQLRQELKNSDGLDWKNTPEQYTETWERKKQRIALSIMTLIGTSPEKTIKFWFNPALLEGLYANKQEEVKNLLAELEGIEPKIIDTQLTKNLSKIKVFIEKREKEIEEAKSVASDLRLEVAEKDEKINKIEGEKETYRAQTLFYQQVTSLDVKQLLSYHHQINLDAIIANNYNKKAIKAIRDLPNSKEILTYLQKASLANRRIIAIAQYAIKANFRSATKKELTDIPAFFEQYLVNVAKDFIAAGLTLEVSNTVEEPFEIKASRIELTILIDNIISNASKAQSRKLSVNISKISTDRLKISFIDDGKGLSKELPSIESMFEMGITTTAGSGFGLYDAKNIVENIDGNISAIPINSKGMEIRIEVNR